MSVLEPGASIRPNAGADDARALALRLYGVAAAGVATLNAYDDRNFFLQEDEHSQADSAWKHGYVLKILNSLDSKKTDMIDAQNRILLFLGSKGIVCPQPIKNKEGKYYSVEKFNLNEGDTKEHVVRLLTFQPGEILCNVPCTTQLMYEAGCYIAHLNLLMKDFHHDAYKHHKTTWMLEQVPLLKNFMSAVQDTAKKALTTETINAFENDVLPHMHKLERGILHGDFNEQNIIVKESSSEKGKWHIHGVIDFGDTHISCYVFELAITACYMMLQSKLLDPLEAPGHVIAGYSSKRNLPDIEFSLLKKCISARLCQSVVLGAYSHQQDPSNPYILTTQQTGWQLLKRLSETPEEQLLQKWQATIRSYSD